MHSVVAYLLSLIATPIIGFATSMLMMPVSLAAHQSGPTAVKSEEFVGRALSAFLMVTAAWHIFGWLDVTFTILPVLIIAGLLTLLNVHGLVLHLRAYEARISDLGFTAQNSGDALAMAVQSDERAQQLHLEVGQQIVAIIGRVAGAFFGAWWYLFT